MFDCVRMRGAVVLAFMVLAMAISVADAGIWRHDRDEQQYVDLGNDPAYAPVVALVAGNSQASGTLISPHWVLTAAHVLDNASSATLYVGGATAGDGVIYSSESLLQNPDWSPGSPDPFFQGTDIALIRLSSPVTDITPASRFYGSDERGMVGTYTGYGQGGDGLQGTTGPWGTKRAGQNIIDAFGMDDDLLDNVSERIMLSDFDHPDGSTNQWYSADPEPLDLEYLPAPGDSGGGVFVEYQGEQRLAGVKSFVAATASDSIEYKYGETVGSIRINQFNHWIDDHIAVGWKSAGEGAFDDPDRWDNSSAAPGEGDIVGFNVAGQSTVTFGQDASVHALLQRDGTVTLELGGHELQLTSDMLEGALTVGKYSSEEATLTVRDGKIVATDGIVRAGKYGQGTLNIESGIIRAAEYLQASGSHLRMEIAGDEDEWLTVTGDMHLAGTMEVALRAGYLPEFGDSFGLLSFGSLSGEFDQIIVPDLPGGLFWDTTELYETGTVTVIPEPATLAMLGIGSLAVSLRRRKNCRTA